ncbi:Crp/Fnr family transcriptional regulator [Pedobacter sp. Leaf216]|uniref:Crp/Fnr family transcriptional regulator n=1 Tax=Pedobacter sp. Leaf216 TaxID=1735684 RepID=UPI0006FC62DA|nr:Crp/Fnr family transcriptional regulator [Pedobacter sp. Leaf216]KQM74787.1 Crp/Fnr family transcriptional regulator [Pedobacter sp. Leaf216]
MNHKLRTHIEEIVTLTDDEFDYVQENFITKKFKKHQFLIQEGEQVKYSYFVVSGLLKLVHTDDSGKQHIVSFAMENWWESDYLAYFNQSSATMSLECLEDTEVCCFTLKNYQTLCKEFQKMQYFFLQKANYGHIGSQRRILSLLTSNAQERYEQLLKEYPALFQRVPKSLLAAYLGVSRETLSRFSQ